MGRAPRSDAADNQKALQPFTFDYAELTSAGESTDANIALRVGPGPVDPQPTVG